MNKTILLSAAVLIAVSFAGCGKPAQEQDEYTTSTVKEPNLPAVQSACPKACKNYVNKCLTLVPNADQELFSEGQDTCESECAAWNEDKVQCMIDAKACEDMTNICGL